MPMFTVTSIIDGDTFDVSPHWRWENQSGCRVRPAGYDAPELDSYGGEAAKQRLARLIQGEQVELRAAYRIDRGRLVCEVFFRNRNLADYFPEFK